MTASPEPFLKAIAPYRDARVVAVACLFTWSWRADLCLRQGLPCVLGHALSMNASQGGQANNDTIDARKIAVVLRGGMRPPASVSPAARRATRDWLRRRLDLTRQRAALVAHVHTTTSPDHLPARGTKLASQANRVGVAERFADPAVQQSLDVDLALLGHDAHRLRDVAVSLLTTATPHDAHTRDWRRTVPGLGAILSLVLVSAIHDLHRCPRGPDFVSSCRLGHWSQASAGTRSGTSGATSGTAPLQGAFCDAAGLFLRDNAAGQKDLARVAKQPGQGQALTGLAHHLARAVDDRLKRPTAFEMGTFLHG